MSDVTKITDIKELQNQSVASSQPILIAKDIKSNPNILLPKKNIDLVKEKCVKSKYSWVPELLLSLSTAALGAFISFLTAGASFNDWKGYVGYIVMPLIVVGCGISWLFVRKMKTQDYNDLISALEKHIFNQTEEEESKNE